MSEQHPEKPPIPTRQASSRFDTLRQLLGWRQIRASFSMSKQLSLRNAALAGLQAAIAAAIALPLVYLSPWSGLIGFAALGALVALFGRFAPARSRNLVVFYCAVLQTVAVLAMSAASWLGSSPVMLLALLALSCGLFFFVTVSSRLGPPGALIFVFAAGAAMTPADSLETVLSRTAATALVAALAWVICALTEGLRQQPTDERPFPIEAMRPLEERLRAAGRISVGAVLAIATSEALGAAHPAWAAMGALAVMQGAHLQISMNRALQRLIGTCIGAFLAWLVLSLDPSVWTLIAILVVLQIATEVIIGSNYGLGQILVTPMALLMTYLAAPGAAGAGMALERVGDTLLGGVIGIVVALLFSSSGDRQDLARQGAPDRKP